MWAMISVHPDRANIATCVIDSVSSVVISNSHHVNVRVTDLRERHL